MEQPNDKLALAKIEKCDKYDYLISAFCGLSAGLIDAFFVGAPGSGILSIGADQAADKFVIKAAQLFWGSDTRSIKPAACPTSLTQCISYLEQAFPVPYDARYASDLCLSNGQLANMSPKNHHILSLSHSPDMIGLIFSIIDQFTNTATFIHAGEIIHVTPCTTNHSIPYLTGSDLPSKLFCGFINWIGHLISDISGSSSTRMSGKTGRGMGIPLPFYNLFLLANFNVSDGQALADIAINVFTRGYDFRHATAMAIPVILNDMLVRIFWALKRRIYHKYSWKDCVPQDTHSSLRWMLIISNTALCLVDALDAAIRSAGNILAFCIRLNIIAWFKLIFLILKEIMIRYSFTYADLKLQFQKINSALDEYLQQLRSIDYAQYEQELQEIREIYNILLDSSASTQTIYAYLEHHGISLQFHNFAEFDEKMQDPQFVLEI